MGQIILEVALGGLLALATTVWLEWLRLPKLRLEISVPDDQDHSSHSRPANYARFLLVSLVNKPLPLLLRWLQRNPALSARATITYHREHDDSPLFGRPNHARWAGSDEPLAMIGRVWNMPASLHDPNKLRRESVVDVYPGESAPFAIAARFDDDIDSYAWSNENYHSQPKWRAPHWRIKPGRYVVKVSISSYGGRCSRSYRLIADGSIGAFRLEEMPTKRRRTRHLFRRKTT